MRRMADPERTRSAAQGAESWPAHHFVFCNAIRGCSSMVEFEFSKLATRVRFPSPAPIYLMKNQIAVFLHRMGISADFLTVTGLLLAFFSAFLIYKGCFFWAGVVLLLSGALDLLDGAVARISKLPNPFGGILDSSLDRYGDGFIFGGILFYCVSTGRSLYAVLAFNAFLGAFSISYIRARAECEVEKCKVGFWERGERLVYVALGLLFNNLPLVLWVLGTLTHWTALQRLFYSKRLLEGVVRARPVDTFFRSPEGRLNAIYFIKITFLFLLVLFYRPVF